MTKRLTIALACNADGSEKLPPLFIGKAEKPRGFTSSTAAELNYLHNANMLMTREIFIKWVRDLDFRFQEQRRHCALLIDSTAVHVGFDVQGLTNIEIVYLPSGSPRNLLPLASGIVAAFKRRYRRRQIQYALDQLDADTDVSTIARFESVGVKQAIAWCIESWIAVPSSMIASCWYETGLVYAESSGFEHDYRGREDAISEELAVMLSWLHAADPLTVEELLDLPEENVIMEEPTDEDFCAPIESVKIMVPQLKPKVADTDGGLPAQELKERLKWIAKLLIYADEKGVPAESVSGLRVLQRDFRDQLNQKQPGNNAADLRQ
ncbi:Retroelement [Phytophthora megakarya]|uniref:Retroelement n=1 Tax=Phytophthora megakarya TaxID=4795 RepID=A0A225ULZ0_9STRA|nr:Retroelement [Phytophthora megakarya]